MNTKHKQRYINKFIMSMTLIFLFLFMFSIPFSSSLSKKDYSKYEIPEKLDIKEKNPLFSSDRTYENDFIKVKSKSKNTINKKTAIFNKHYVSISEYEKLEEENFEVSFYTGNDGVPYKVLKSNEVNIPKQKVIDEGYIYANKVYSKDGYVTIKTSGFSTLILDMPDLEIPFNNLISLDLQNYFSDVNHYYVAFVDEGNVDPNYAVVISEGFASLNTDTFEVNLYRDSGNAYLDLQAYEQICSTEITNTSEDCFYLESDVNSGFFGFNNIKVYACDVGQTTQSNAGSLSSNCSTNTNFDLNTFTSAYYYRTGIDGRTGLHENLIDSSDFNYFWYDEPNSELVTKWGNSISNSGSTYTEVNEFKAGGYEGGAFDFDGTNDLLDLGNFITSSIGSGDFTLNIWLNIDTNDATARRPLYAGASASSRDFIQIATESGTIKAYSRDGTTGISTLTSGSVNNDEWYMVTLTRTGTTAELFLNGISVDTLTNSEWGVNINAVASVLELGADTNDNLYYDGTIDEFLAFNKILSDTEILYLYNNGNGVDFFNLNTPQRVGISAIEHNKSIGTYNYYLNNYFVWDSVDAQEYTFTYEYYDHITEQWLNLTSGFSTTVGAPSDVFGLALLGDKLTLTYYGNTDPTLFGFDGVVYAQNQNGDIAKMTLSFYFPLTPEVNVSRLATPQYQQTTNFSLSMNTYYGNYTDILVEYQDYIFDNETLYNVALNTSVTGGIINEVGNINVTLDPLDVSGNIYLNVYEVPGKTFSDEMTITAYNSISNLSDVIYITSGDVLPPVDLIKSNMTNITIVEGGNSELIDLDDFFYNISDFNVTTVYDNVTYNVSNPTRPVIFAYTNVNDSNGTVMFDMWIKQGFIEDTNTIDFDLKALPVNSTQKITVDVVDNDSNTATQNFYIIVTPTVSMTKAQSYLSNLGSLLTGYFPDASTLTSIEKIGIIVGVILCITLLVLALAYKQMGDNAIKLAIGLDVLAFLLLLGLGYVSIGFMIFIALLLIGLSYLKFRS